jgi:putative membrane protein
VRILLAWAIHAGCLLLVAWLVPGVIVGSFTSALIAALVLGLLNLLIRPILLLLTLPINLLTLGLFTFVINGALFQFAAYFLEGFSVESFGWAVLGAAVYSITSGLCNLLVLRDRD